MTLARELLDRLPARPARRVSVVCVTAPGVGTLGTFYIDGHSTTAYPCRIQGGSTFSSGESGMADWTPPSLPICFKTT